MQDLNLFGIYLNILNENKIQYFVTGSVASIVYGEPRLTNDIDLVIFLNKIEVKRFVRAFPAEQFYCPPEEIILNELNREAYGHFNLIHHQSGFKADIYLAGKEKLQHWAFDNIQKIEFSGLIINVAPPEYVIIKKLEFYKEGKSEKHLIDIRGILENSKELLNFKFLDESINSKGLNEFWEKVK